MAAPLGSALTKIGTRFCCRLRRFKTLSSIQCIPSSSISHLCIDRHYCLQHSTPDFIKNQRNFSSLHKDRKCWKCGSPTDEEKELFFCNCGVVQSVPEDLTYFKVMNCEEKFDIDTNSLSRLYKDLQRKLHPDKYSQRSKEELALAEQQSAFVNRAYNTLLKPLTRGQYLLEIHGDPIDESTSAVNPNFLMEIMEFNEDIAEAVGNKDAVGQLDNINSSRMEKCVEEVSKAFAADDVPKAKECLIKLKYFTNIDDKIKDIFRKHMDQ
ncbi:iron-sulfur cluster co-chaperone protein HscB-like [Mercenaria mercenaria]|uniref:iron-sulfur cluster co-chaperone protein HscB-like n=1 Tax=Mercenaria mercenaria TaxID=6596 RepID=UPI00234E5FAC|nr:iron-sulfur cluster co-chaperone protein HscB-like [Mercenaria mercenaria]